jgi:hypothetical protein
LINATTETQVYLPVDRDSIYLEVGISRGQGTIRLEGCGLNLSLTHYTSVLLAN